MSSDWNNQFSDTAKPIKKNSRNGVTEAANATQALTLKTTTSALTGASSALEALARKRDLAVNEVAQTVADLTSAELFMGDVLLRVSEIQNESEPTPTSILNVDAFFPIQDLESLMPKCLRLASSNSSETLNLRSADLDS